MCPPPSPSSFSPSKLDNPIRSGEGKEEEEEEEGEGRRRCDGGRSVGRHHDAKEKFDDVFNAFRVIFADKIAKCF